MNPDSSKEESEPHSGSSPTVYPAVPPIMGSAVQDEKPLQTPAAVAGQPNENTWAPPPKPGLIPLRPLSFGTLIAAPFQLLRRNPSATFGSALLIQFVITLVTVLTVGGVALFSADRLSSARSDEYNAIENGSIVLLLLSALLPLALALVGFALLQGILIVEVSSETLGEKRRFSELWKTSSRRLWPQTLWLFLSGGVVVLAVAVLILGTLGLGQLGPAGLAFSVLFSVIFGFGLLVLGCWIGTKLSLVSCIIVLEKRGVKAAITRSWKLTSGAFWKTFGTQILVSAIVQTANQFVTLSLSIVFGLSISFFAPNGTGSDSYSTQSLIFFGTNILFGLIFGSIGAVANAGVTCLIYLDRRMRTEGLDLELVRFVEARQMNQHNTLKDPFLVGLSP